MVKPPLKVEVTIKDDVAVIKLAANFHTSTPMAHKLKEELGVLLAKGIKYYVINMSEVFSIDSEGLGTLTFGYKESKQLGGGLVLCQLTNRDVFDVIEIVNLHNLIPILKSEDEAIENFKMAQ